MLKKDLNDFISNRLDDIIENLESNNINYVATRQKYSKLYDELYNELTDDQQLKLEKMISMLTGISFQEIEAMYITAVQDITKIENEKFINIID